RRGKPRAHPDRSARPQGAARRHHRRSRAELMKYVPRLLHYLKPYKLLWVGSVLLTFFGSFTGLLAPWPLKILIDNVLGGRPLPWFLGAPLGPIGHDTTLLLLVVVLASLGIHLLINLVTVLSEYVNTKLNLSVVLDFRSDLFQHAQRLSVAYTDEMSTGRL